LIRAEPNWHHSRNLYLSSSGGRSVPSVFFKSIFASLSLTLFQSPTFFSSSSSSSFSSLQEIIKKDKLYNTEYLNDKLYLHYKGFRKIQNLEKYTGLKVLWLEGNGLDKIEGLENQAALRTLYLQENIISKIENLEANVLLDTLNLSKNFVTRIENLSHCKSLHTLILSNNNLKNADSLAGAADIPELQALDVQSCKIDEEDPSLILDILASCKELKVLYLKGNDVVKRIRNYRKMVISTCKELRYLDDRPVFDDERRRCDRWRTVFDETGGDVDKAMEAEREEITAIREEKKAREERAFKQFEVMVREGQKVKEANREAERKKNGGELDGAKSMVSTDAKKFGRDGATVDENVPDGGKFMHLVDRDRDENNTNPFSGEPIVPAEESDLVRDARNERWGPGSEQRVLSSNVDVSSEAPPPPPPPGASGGGGDIWGADEVMTEEAKEEAEIEARYTREAGDKASWEKGEDGNGNAAASMDSKMAAELAMLQAKGEATTAGKIKENEARMEQEREFKNGGVTMPPPAPPSSAVLKEIGGSSQVGVGGAWPVKGAEAASRTDFEELD